MDRFDLYTSGRPISVTMMLRLLLGLPPPALRMQMSRRTLILAGSYTDASGNLLTGASSDLSSVGIAVYTGADGLEEMHCFLGLGWFDTGSWAWGHYIAEWGTKGVFQVSAADSAHNTFRYATGDQRVLSRSV